MLPIILAAVIMIVVVIIIGIIVSFSSKSSKSDWVTTENFEWEKSKIKPYCSDDEFLSFMQFLHSYRGGYVRRRAGKIVYQDYLGKEKGDLKGIFFHVIVPNPNLSISNKESFRIFLMSIGVTGVNTRPSYETRDSKLKNTKTDENEFRRKEVGNSGEQAVRDILKRLDTDKYAVINGPVLKNGDNVKEYDHIVVGENGLFSIETKAFGMSDGKTCKAALFIDKGDKWIIRKNKNNRELESPTDQVMDEKKHLERIIPCPAFVHPVLVLSNAELYVKNNIDLPYDVIKVNELQQFIQSYQDTLSDSDRALILRSIDESRIN